MGRFSSLLPHVLVTVALCSLLASSGPGYAQESGVFRARDREGRIVYTNLQGSASHGKPLERVNLPELTRIDFERIAPAQLSAVDAQVRASHSALQAGEQCEAIRKSARTGQRIRLWADHGRKFSVIAALLVFTAMLGALGRGRKLGSLWPLPPLAGCIFLGYATFRDVQSMREALTAGLRACSQQLPEGASDDRDAVLSRLAKALDLQNVVNAAHARQAAATDAFLNGP